MMNDDDEWLMFRDWWWMPDHDKNGDETVHLRSSYLQVPSNRVLSAPQVETRSVPWCSRSCHVAVTSQTNHPHSGDSEILTSRLSWLCQPQVLGYAGNHKIIQDRSFLGRSYPILELWSRQTVIWYWAAAHLDLDIQKMKFSWPEAKKKHCFPGVGDAKRGITDSFMIRCLSCVCGSWRYPGDRAVLKNACDVAHGPGVQNTALSQHGMILDWIYHSDPQCILQAICWLIIDLSAPLPLHGSSC